MAQLKKVRPTPTDYEEALHPTKKTAILGKGSYGIVKLVREKANPNGPFYAMKMINKSLVVKSGSVGILNREIKIHKKLEHPHIIRLHHAFEDKQNLYLILDYAENGNLFQYLRKKKKLSEKEAFIYFFQTAVGIDYLHKKGILHRDLKPENLLLDHNGNVKVCDFGWSAETSDIRTTFCGTVDYMAPEMVDRKPHDYKVDIWSLGVLLYELIHGHEPFRAKLPTEKFQQILKNDYIISPEVSTLAKDLIQRLLRADPKERLDFQDIFEHGWLKKFEKELKVTLKEYIYVPSNKSKTRKEEEVVPSTSKSKILDDPNDTVNTSLNVSAVEFEPISLKDDKRGALKLYKNGPNSIDFDGPNLKSSRSFAEATRSPSSHHNRNASVIAIRKNSFVSNEAKEVSKSIQNLPDDIPESFDFSNNRASQTHSTSISLLWLQHAHNSNELGPNPVLFRKSKSAIEGNGKILSEIAQRVKDVPNHHTELKRKILMGTSPKSDGSPQDFQRKHARHHSDNIFALTKQTVINNGAQGREIKGKAGAKETIASPNSNKLNQRSLNCQTENQAAGSNLQFSNLERCFEELLDSRDETLQILTKIEEFSRTSIGNDPSDRNKLVDSRAYELKNGKKEASNQLAENMSPHFEPCKRIEASRRSISSVDMESRHEISDIDINLSRIDEPNSDEDRPIRSPLAKSKINSKPVSAGKLSSAEKCISFLSKIKDYPDSARSEEGKSNIQEIQPLATKKKTETKELASTRSLKTPTFDQKATDRGSRSKKTKQGTDKKRSSGIDSCKYPEETSPYSTSKISAQLNDLSGRSLNSGTLDTKEILSESKILKEIARQASGTHRSKLFRQYQKKLQDVYTDELNRIEASLIENESPSTGLSLTSHGSSGIKLQKIKNDSNYSISSSKLSKNDFSDELIFGSPAMTKFSAKTSKNEQQKKTKSITNKNALESPGKLQNWLTSRRSDKDFDLTYVPKQHVYQYKTSHRSSRQLDSVSRRTIEKQKLAQSKKAQGFFEQIINLMTCGNKRDC